MLVERATLKVYGSLAGVNAFRNERCAEAVPEVFGLSASTVSRRFKRANARKRELMERRPVFTRSASVDVSAQVAGGWLNAAVETYVAYTETDDAGRFFLCRVNTPLSLEVSRDAFRDPPDWSRWVPGTSDMV